MKIWDLEREYDRLIPFISEGRERRKASIGPAVQKIKKELLAHGEAALVEFSKRWDGWEKEYPLKVTEDEIREAAEAIPHGDRAIIRGMIQNVRAFHRFQKSKSRTYRSRGLLVKEEFVPVEKAMVYVPGGTAPYPSSVTMGVVPAQLAGVKEIFLATPAKKGAINPYILAACSMLGVTEVFRIGGAQAVFAFSFGIGPIPKVDIIVGPGNAYVEEAKRDVYGRVGIDMLAGPSELVVLATEAFSPRLLAWDLMSQAEHDEMAMVGLISPSEAHLREVEQEIDSLIGSSPRAAVTRKALDENGFLARYKDIDKAISLVNAIAPEHMELIGDEALGERILYPGILYVGPSTPVALGDYYIGTNHVLPTSGAGRFTGGLSVDTFLRRKMVVKAEKEFITRYGDNAERLARIEGLFAHGEAIKARKESK
ncbi:MAG TPA: histidinol dehydrogenase [Syntrophorhabdaceae bacterium]|jgi:histidinol dehydrogenase